MASRYQERLEGGADFGGNRRGAAGGPVDVDVHEVAGGGRLRVAGAEEGQLVAHAGIAQLRHAHARIDRVGEGERAGEAAARLHHHSEDRAQRQVENAAVEEEAVHCRVEERVVHGVVDVAVDVVVGPARLDAEEMRVFVAAHAAILQGRVAQCALSDSSFTRVSVAIQFTSQVLPPSSENACSTWEEFGAMSEMTNRTSMVLPLNGC